VTGCVVDSEGRIFACVKKNERSEIAFKDGAHLLCSSPEDTESFMKACKRGQIIEVALCSYKIESDSFFCTLSNQQAYERSVDQTNNYFCVSANDRKRILERCSASY
jgi:hypothetical protein